MPPHEAQDRSATPSAEPEPRRCVTLEFIDESEAWSSFGALDEIVAGVLGELSRHARLVAQMPAEACVALMDDEGVHRLNLQFRGIDKPTNVLSFPAPLRPGDTGVRFLGDMALGYQTVMREAGELGIPAADHLRHLILHGLLHLMGYDHETEADAAVMEGLETEILGRLGIADPYAEAAAAPGAP